MLWLRSIVETKGGKFVTHHISGDLFEQEDALLRVFGAQYIVDATGLGAFEAAGDRTVYPLRGALIRLVNDGTKFPKVTEALVVAHDYAKRDDDGGIVFIVPRNDKTLILGGKHYTSPAANAGRSFYPQVLRNHMRPSLTSRLTARR